MSKEIDAMIEGSKATQEVAKTASNAIDASRGMGNFIARFVSGPLEQGAGIIEDKLRYIRWERRERLIIKAEQFLEQQGLSSPDKPISLKNAVPLLEYATLEEDDDLQDLWAKLLVNGTNSSTGINLERSFIEILAQISSLEAQILLTIYSLPYEETRHYGITTSNLPDSAEIVKEGMGHILPDPTKEVQMALASLSRLGCLKFAFSFAGGEIFSQVNPTLMGKELVQACTLQK